MLPALKHFSDHGLAKGDTDKSLTDTTDLANTNLELGNYKDLFLNLLYITVISVCIINHNLDESAYLVTLSKK